MITDVFSALHSFTNTGSNLLLSGPSTSLNPNASQLSHSRSNTDVVFRLQRSAATTQISAALTSQLQDYFFVCIHRYQTKISTLREVVKWQRSRLEYSALHTAYLLEAISEEEFAEEAVKYSSEQVSMSQSEIAEKILAIRDALGEEAEKIEYDDLLGIETYEVQSALRLLEGGASTRGALDATKGSD